MSSNRTAWAQARRLLLASAALAAFAQNVPAQSNPELLSLEDAVQKAISAHPALAAQSARVSAAAALVQQAGLRPNPRISLQSENWSLTGADPISTSINSDQFAYFNQTFETAGKRDRRVGLSRANHQLSGLERDLLERQIASRVKLAYWSAVGTERVRDLWVQQIQGV